MTTLFISDLHLDANQPNKTQLFQDYLLNLKSKPDAIYILGDLFEYWVGDDISSEFHQNVIKTLQEITKKNIPVYFMPGNRDFLIGKRFAKQTGCQLLTDPTVINIYDRNILLMHGDSLCTHDKRHQRFRKFTQNKISKNLFLKLPISIREKIANKLRNISKQTTQRLSLDVMDVTAEEIPKVMQQFNVKELIHGHTHRPTIELLINNDSSCERIVLSDWGKLGNALLYHPDGRKELIYFAEN